MSAVLQSPQARFEPLLSHRLDEVLRIEQIAYDHPWSLENFRDALNSLLAGRRASATTTATGTVIVHGDENTIVEVAKLLQELDRPRGNPNIPELQVRIVRQIRPDRLQLMPLLGRRAEIRKGPTPEETLASVSPARAELQRRIGDQATAVAPNGVAHAPHEIRCCRGLRSTSAHSR